MSDGQATPKHQEIDDKQAIFVEKANTALASMRGKSAQWWDYTVSHLSFTLIVGDAMSRGGNVALFLGACKNISGPTYWENQNLEVIWECDRSLKRGTWNYTLIDKSSGFKSEFGIFTWLQDYNLLKRGPHY